ncbi:MAG: hypothetical protein RBT33_00410 [Candidatus Dojkabacteria bacterium]|jgi:uncharacterized repeat protein (TIGR01451 family)|nr:hypothetical protein [Candidatus Dojkabacteria bacterium]
MRTQSRNTKRALRVLLIVGGILIVALIGAVIYFYAIADTVQEEQKGNQITCGCYMIDPAVVNDCGDPKKAFLFSSKSVPSDQACSIACDTQLLSEYVIKSSTATDRFKSCNIRSISDARCQEMILTDQDGKLITGKINPEDEVNIEATFDNENYSNYTFKINTQSNTPDKIEGKKIYKKVTDFKDVNSLDILATATDSKGDSINSIICRRVIDINVSGSTGANALTATTERQSDGRTKISQITISVGQLSSENVKVSFSFGTKFQTLTTEGGLNIESAKGTVTITKANLYDATNFVGDQSFAILDNHEGPLPITAEVFVDDTSIGVVSTEVEFLSQEVPVVEETDEEEEEEESHSNFSTSKIASPSCIERVESNNVATFTISIKNNSDITQEITSIKDKLPLGFTYVVESTVVNGTAATDGSLTTVSNIGSTQEIVWQQSSPWSVVASGQLTIVFRAKADSNALTGENLNEVIVNPVQIPSDPSTLRSQASIVVAQDCDNPTVPVTTPSTGILDNLFVRLAIGIVLFATAWAVYTRPEGVKLSQIILNSDIYKDAEMTKYKYTNPKKYFEEKIVREKK